jgi:ATP phosphoribosyltransferase regulatory subunit
MRNERWLLPEGIDEVLPPDADRLESMRRALLDRFRAWGYELIIPPFVEYLESLLTGTGRDLDLQTFKLTDQLTGRLMGVRADITPQAARIDAHQLRRATPTRLCYLGTVLHTRSDGFAGSRAPLQIGAELFGHAGVESDCEILCLMMETLALAGVRDVYLDLGHVGIFRGLARQAGLDGEQELALFEALQRKALPEIDVQLAEFGVGGEPGRMLAALAALNGDDVLGAAREALRAAAAPVHEALDYLERMAEAVRARLPDVPLHFDLAELRAYHYQTGVVFAAFVPGLGEEIARGGRYDHVGEVFGRARPATGFSADLKKLLRVAERPAGEAASGIFAPAADDPGLRTQVEALRRAGERVLWELPGQPGGAREMGCDRVLRRRRGRWVVDLA